MGLTSRSGSKSAYDTNPNSRNSSASIYVTSRSEGEILQSPNLKSFSYNVLRAATRNFRPDSVLGEDAFGLVFKGWIDENSLAATKPGRGMTVAVKRLNGDGFQGHKEWLHPNLVRLIGYCLEDDHRFLVYEFMSKGSVRNHLLRRGSYFQLFFWSLRMKIVLGAAKGLAFLHSTEPNIIHRNFNTSNILLDTNYNAKLSDFGLARDGPTGDESHVSTRVMGTNGYAAPEYLATDLPPDKEPLDWNIRMKIAAGTAKGLEYLHDKANPPVIHRNLKPSNILLDEGYNPKLSDFGLAKLGPVGDKTHVSTRVMGTVGYIAPEYAMTGQLTEI